MEKAFQKRVKISFFFILLFAFFILAKLFWLQIIEGDRFSEAALLNHQSHYPICFERGKIMDRNFNILAIDIESLSICAFPKKIKDPYTCAYTLSQILNIPHYQILEEIKKDTSFVWIKRKTSLKEEAIKEIEKLEGIGIIKEYRRVYPKDTLCAQVLGFAGMDNRGLEGIELQFDSYLYREPKFITLLKDAKHSLIYEKIPPSPSASYTLVLTIDEVLQSIAERRLKEWCKKFSAKSGCVIIMCPYTAQILAMALYPEFNPNFFVKYSPWHWRNRAIADIFEPGSIFKIITMVTALKNGISPYNKQLFCEGFVKVGGRIIRCHQKHGSISFADAIKYSCNAGVVQIVQHIPNDYFWRHIKDFGFGEFTGVQLPGEVRGILRSPKEWKKTSKDSISIGYEISCTPLQMISALLPFANGGYLMRPIIVKEILDKKGRCIKRTSPRIVKKVLDDEVIEEARKILESVVKDGTGVEAASPCFTVAGKTGTAKKAEEGMYKEEKVVSSFVGFFPSSKPKIAMLTLIDEPKGVYWGGKVAAPLFGKIAQDISLYLEMKEHAW